MKAIVQGGSTIASLGERILGRTTAEDIVDSQDQRGRHPAGHPARRGDDRADRGDRPAVGPDPLAAGLRIEGRRLRHLLRARSRPRHAGQHRRGGRRHRGAVDRRAGHPADDADLPHRRRGAAQRAVSNLDAVADGKLEYRDLPTIVDPRGRRITLARNGEIAIVDMEGRERATHRLPYGAHAAVRRRRNRLQGRSHRRVGSVHSCRSSPRSGGTVPYPGHDREPHGARGDRRRHRHLAAGRHRGSSRSRKKDDFRPRITLLDENSGEAARLHG